MKDKLLHILAWIAAVGFAVFFCYQMILEARAVSSTTMEEINVVQMIYDQGIEKYEQGSHKQGCYMIHQAVKQAWLIQGDDKFTYNQVNTVYQELCKQGG